MAGPVRVEEAYTERDETIDAKGNVTEIEIPYFVFGVSDESAALAAAKPKVKAVRGMTLESIEVIERINGDTWKAKAVYEIDFRVRRIRREGQRLVEGRLPLRRR